MSLGVQDTIRIGLNGSDGVSVNASDTEVGTNSIYATNAFAAGSTNVAFSIAWTVANTQSILLVSTTNMTIKTNSSGSPANTITLAANVPLIWFASGAYYANPFTTNVTEFFITCTNAGTLQARVLTT